jgi:hypothetical protein
MQIIPAFIYQNWINCQLDVEEDGTLRNYRVYANPIKIYKNIDNTIKIVFKNRDQKRIVVNEYTFVMYVFKSNSATTNRVAARDGTGYEDVVVDVIDYTTPVLVKSVDVVDDGVTPAKKGVATVVISADEIASLVPDSYLFSIKAIDSFGQESPVYSDSNLGVSGVMYIVGDVYGSEMPEDSLDLGTLG